MAESEPSPVAVPTQHQFAVRIVSIDYYMTRPTPGLDECYSQLEGRGIDLVPVIRIFGSTGSGQKTCVHVHGAFPYFYIPLDGPPPATAAEADGLMRRLAAGIEAGSIATTEQGAPVRRQRVFATHLVRARKFYGYHAEEQLFVKILLYNPMDMTRVSGMLQGGQVLGQPFQPHESHIPFLLQFKIDFNLFGMGHLRLDEVFFRPPIPEAETAKRPGWQEAAAAIHHELGPSGEALLQSSQVSGEAAKKWLQGTIPSQWLPENVPSNVRLPERQSCCELEVDARIESILNRRQLVRTALEDAATEEQLVESLIPMWDEERQRSGGELPPAPSSPPRMPRPLCQTVNDIRAQFQVIADAQQAAAATEGADKNPEDSEQRSSPQAAETPRPPASQQCPEETPKAASAASPKSPALIAATPAANVASALRGAPSSRVPSASSSLFGRAPEEELEVRGDLNLWGEEAKIDAPDEEMEGELQELMEWLHDADEADADGSSDPLLSLAQHAHSQMTPAAPSMKREALERVSSLLMSQAQKESEDILEASQQDQLPTPPSHRQLRTALQDRAGTLQKQAEAEADPGHVPYDPGGFEGEPKTPWPGLRFATGVFAEGKEGAVYSGGPEIDLAAAERVAGRTRTGNLQDAGSPSRTSAKEETPGRIPQADGASDDWTQVRRVSEQSPLKPSLSFTRKEGACLVGPMETERSSRELADLEDVVSGMRRGFLAMKQRRIPQVDGGGDGGTAEEISDSQHGIWASEGARVRAGSPGDALQAAAGNIAPPPALRDRQEKRPEPSGRGLSAANLASSSLQAGGEGGGLEQERKRRSLEEVRRTHALSAAAWNFLEGSRSGPERRPPAGNFGIRESNEARAGTLEVIPSEGSEQPEDERQVPSVTELSASLFRNQERDERLGSDIRDLNHGSILPAENLPQQTASETLLPAFRGPASKGIMTPLEADAEPSESDKEGIPRGSLPRRLPHQGEYPGETPPKRSRRSFADVRRTHALTTAASNFLEGRGGTQQTAPAPGVQQHLTRDAEFRSEKCQTAASARPPTDVGGQSSVADTPPPQILSGASPDPLRLAAEIIPESQSLALRAKPAAEGPINGLEADKPSSRAQKRSSGPSLGLENPTSAEGNATDETLQQLQDIIPDSQPSSSSEGEPQHRTEPERIQGPKDESAEIKEPPVVPKSLAVTAESTRGLAGVSAQALHHRLGLQRVPQEEIEGSKRPSAGRNDPEIRPEPAARTANEQTLRNRASAELRESSFGSDNLAAGSLIFLLREKPPTREALEGRMEALGIPPRIARVPHYGNPQDLPVRPPVFSGIQYKLPTAAVAELKAFASGVGNAPGPFERLKALQRATGADQAMVDSPRSFVMLPAKSPPHPEAVKRWLEAVKAAQQTDQSAISSPASFGMDPNTGKLLPREALSQDSGGAARDSDLLGTPLFSTPAAAPSARKLRVRSRLGVTPQPGSGGSQPPSRGSERRPNSPKYDERSHFFTPVPPKPDPPEEEVRPSSPKYDERTFFYTTPQVNLPSKTKRSPWKRPAKQSAADVSLGKRKPTKGLFDGSPFAKKGRWVSQITGPSPLLAKSQTPVSQAGFKWKVAGKGQQLTLLSIEVQADTRGSLLPDPRYDQLRCIAMAVMDDDEVAADLNFTVRILMWDEKHRSVRDGIAGAQVEAFGSEPDLIKGFVDAVRALDPDIILGWEIQQSSLGYIVDRATKLELPYTLLRAISRTPEISSVKERQNDEYGQLHASGIHSAGRVVLNLWRLLRSEVKLNIYTFEACVAALLQLRTPHVPPWVLAMWFSGGPAGGRWRALEYWSKRARLNLALLEQLDLIGRTGELARAFGIDFFSVLTRGSQYRVESLLVRLAHSQNYLMLSPSREQVGRQPAMECIPLVMEPESTMYSDPVVVLDYQSLYPSQIIAYNLCFCTCLGRPAHARDPSQAHKLGASELLLPAGTLTDHLAPEKLTVSPNGVAWAPKAARAGVVPRLLREILQTRIMVKAAMKRHPASAKVLQRVLNARQFGLKLIANVTYGYAAAGFSGRMPMAELADAIVQSGRQTLENTIQMVESQPQWKARVVYGDTDSLFVLLPGRSRAEAFRIGAEIASQATAANPPPVTLKMEKVYQPCVLASKKRYVGFMYESPAQQEPAFDAKGIETVRRDSCPVVAKMLERSIRILFSTHDLSLVKEYAERQWHKILAGRVSLADFVFAKEVRLGTYSNKGPAPPAAVVAAKAMAQDPRAEPRFSERVPYVVVHGPPGARLVDMVVPPHALVEAAGKLRLHANYYITKQIVPALERVLNLVGGDPRAWFAAMARPSRLLPQKRPPTALPIHDPTRGASSGTIDRYYLSRHCAVCDALTHAVQPLCESCRRNPQLSAAVLSARSSRLDRHNVTLVRICLHCGGGGTRAMVPASGSIACDSLDCAIFYERRKTAHELAAVQALESSGLTLLESTSPPTVAGNAAQDS